MRLLDEYSLRLFVAIPAWDAPASYTKSSLIAPIWTCGLRVAAK